MLITAPSFNIDSNGHKTPIDNGFFYAERFPTQFAKANKYFKLRVDKGFCILYHRRAAKADSKSAQLINFCTIHAKKENIMNHELLNLIEINSELSAVQRFSQSKLATPESVLEHSGSVCLFAYFIGNQLIQEGHSIDMGQLLSKAIVHDIDECLTGDIARPIKYSSEEIRSMLNEIETNAVADIDDQTYMNGVLNKDWLTAKVGVEGSIVALCDVLTVVYKCYDEIIVRGNLSMEKYVVGIGGLFVSKVRAIQSELDKPSPFLKKLSGDGKLIVDNIIEKITTSKGSNFL